MASEREQLDIFDDAGRHVGTKGRTSVHRDGDWHQVFHVLIVRPTARPSPTVVLQRRSRDKVAFPELLDFSATGHLAAGETPLDGRRELAEELGVESDPADLVSLGVRRIVEAGTEGTLNKELAHFFLLADDRPLSDFRPEPTEVSHAVEVTIDDLLDLFADRTSTAPARFFPADGGEVGRIRRRDFVPGAQYWIAALVMADRFAAGRTPLAI